MAKPRKTKADPGNHAELVSIKAVHGLTVEDIANITLIARSTVTEWLAGSRPMPNRSMRLLKLELGLARPAWTAKQRAA
jgi:transcriptional regulator with XRE-family HTH domain